MEQGTQCLDGIESFFGFSIYNFDVFSKVKHGVKGDAENFRMFYYRKTLIIYVDVEEVFKVGLASFLGVWSEKRGSRFGR